MTLSELIFSKMTGACINVYCPTFLVILVSTKCHPRFNCLESIQLLFMLFEKCGHPNSLVPPWTPLRGRLRHLIGDSKHSILRPIPYPLYCLVHSLILFPTFSRIMVFIQMFEKKKNNPKILWIIFLDVANVQDIVIGLFLIGLFPQSKPERVSSSAPSRAHGIQRSITFIRKQCGPPQH